MGIDLLLQASSVIQVWHAWVGDCVKLLRPVLGIILSAESIFVVTKPGCLRIRPEIDICKK